MICLHRTLVRIRQDRQVLQFGGTVTAHMANIWNQLGQFMASQKLQWQLTTSVQVVTAEMLGKLLDLAKLEMTLCLTRFVNTNMLRNISDVITQGKFHKFASCSAYIFVCGVSRTIGS